MWSRAIGTTGSAWRIKNISEVVHATGLMIDCLLLSAVKSRVPQTYRYDARWAAHAVAGMVVMNAGNPNNEVAKQRVLILTSDAFGGRGGIAQYNRDLITALIGDPTVGEVVVVPRNVHSPPAGIPNGVTFDHSAAGNKARFALRCLWSARRPCDVVICGHINLLPLALAVAKMRQARLALLVYGIEVWKQHPSKLTSLSLHQVDAIWSISEFTRGRLEKWSRVPTKRYSIIPNGIDLSRYHPGEKNPALECRLGVRGRRVLLTLARLPSAERCKGVDEVLDAMPYLVREFPDLTYVVAGDGEDRGRLEQRAAALGLGDRVIFTGFFPEEEKTDLYRLADAFALPGRGEGFGFVFLEALACGTPVVASSVDGSREALRNGLLGEIVDPQDPLAVRSAIAKALMGKRGVRPGLRYFAMDAFQARVRKALADLMCDHQRH